MPEKLEKEPPYVLRAVKAHPWITGIFVFCVILSIGLSLWFLPGDWSTTRKVAAGVI
ncbi:MAG: hypothetical protein O7C75_19320 [Verrucomicrobia bacterium]|nr:hypothetical protein [Verrucomicrobiota bacterium]